MVDNNRPRVIGELPLLPSPETLARRWAISTSGIDCQTLVSSLSEHTIYIGLPSVRGQTVVDAWTSGCVRNARHWAYSLTVLGNGRGPRV